MDELFAAMTPARLTTLAAEREKVVTTIADLERDLVAIAESTAAGPDDEHDAEGSTVGYERARVMFLVAQARQRLSSIETALTKAGAGLYGRCEGCDEPIEEERLEALPATTRCAPCASKQVDPLSP